MALKGFEPLDILRQKISDTDDQIMELIAERMRLCLQVGTFKKSQQLPIKDYATEKRILEKVRNKAQTLGSNPDLYEKVFSNLIEHSVELQDQLFKTQQHSPESGHKILVIGGAGGMGQWLCQLFQSFNHLVSIYDTIPNTKGDFAQIPCLDSPQIHDFDIIVIATPISVCKEILEQLIELAPSGLIVEICSLKNHLIDTLDHAIAKGLQVASIHPMYGPQVSTLFGRNILICDHPGQNPECIRKILSYTSADLIDIPLKDHDTLMSYVLGSAHFLNFIFADTLKSSGFSMQDFLNCAGTTFLNQHRVCREVVSENKDLYYEIQAFNEETPKVIHWLQTALHQYAQTLKDKDKEAFTKLMEANNNFFNSESP